MTNQSSKSATPLLVIGIVFLILGGIAIATPAIAGKMVVIVVGAMLLVAGIIQAIAGLRSQGGSGKWMQIIQGAFVAICGAGLLSEPWIGMKYIALLLAIFFVIEGIWKIITSFSYRFASGWLAILASGVVSLALGYLIWNQWPVSGMWAVGILVGVNLLMTGIAMIVLSTTIRRLGDIVANSKEA